MSTINTLQIIQLQLENPRQLSIEQKSKPAKYEIIKLLKINMAAFFYTLGWRMKAYLESESESHSVLPTPWNSYSP